MRKLKIKKLSYFISTGIEPRALPFINKALYHLSHAQLHSKTLSQKKSNNNQKIKTLFSNP
jgi:hypothetical protein